MPYIIVWRNSHKEPHIDVNSRGFKQMYITYEDAKEEAEEIIKSEGPESKWYFDYAIYEEVNS